MTWEATVLLNGIPTKMSFKAESAVQARTYFETFGKVISDLRILAS